MQNMSETLPEKLTKPYDPAETEGRVYEMWEKSGYFNPDKLPIRRDAHGKPIEMEPFSIVLPPPNVTGTLHMGHADMLVIEDIMVRFERMRGKKALWLPGTDHAAIATQSKVEKILEKEEGKRRHDLGREEFLKRVEKFAQESHDTIVNQVRKMGASVDWSREAFTLDEKRSLAVRTAFKQMYEDGLIYRGNRIVNWDPKGQTTVSDDEVDHKETKGKLYTFKYSHDFPIPIATTRPETKIGDTGIAVHPEGKWKEYIGKEFTIKDFAGYELTIKIVPDDGVDENFGTGAVGLTPAHSQTDWDIAQKNNLPVKQVIDGYAKIIDGPLAGKKTLEAREAIVTWLKDQGIFEKEEEIAQNISVAERSGGTIEPLPKLQWFIAVNKEFTGKDGKKTTLKKLMREAVESTDIKIIPERFEKIYYHWIDNLRDWCISRQIWYGHRVPVWYRSTDAHGKSNGTPSDSRGVEVHCGIEAPEGTGPATTAGRWEQDSDTLDTWFSSGLWTFSTLGWPDKNAPDLKTYHPTTVLETGYDILFFWVARMILMSEYFLGEVPFKTVYLHGLVRDSKGRKMSKSLGNIVDPLDMIAKYGADATRLSLIVGAPAGSDVNLSEDKIRGYKNFANKIWNASRFVLQNLDGFSTEKTPEITEQDKETLKELDETLTDVTKDIEEYRFYLAGEKLYHYFWHSFADKIIENAKPRLLNGSTEEKLSAQYTLFTILSSCIKALHPFMPFITEEIWSMLPIEGKEMLIIESWPTAKHH